MGKNPTILFYDTKPYDRQSFDEANRAYNFDIQYLNVHLNDNTASLSQGYTVVCPFVNDSINKKTIDILKNCGVELIALSTSAAVTAMNTSAKPPKSRKKINMRWGRLKDWSFCIAAFSSKKMQRKDAGDARMQRILTQSHRETEPQG